MIAALSALPAISRIVGDHLWQSTLVVGATGLLALALRRNRAHVRHWIWLAASIKFLVPFAALVAIGRQLQWRTASIAQPEITFVINAMSQPFSGPELASIVALPPTTSTNVASLWPFLLVAIWLAGCVALLFTWCRKWRRVAKAVRLGLPIHAGRELEMLRRLAQISGIKRSITLVMSDESIEPGVFGILRPTLLWPRGIGEHLSDRQVEAILAHEVCHVRRRDNLAAALHMLVEAVFWFHPLVWWIGARLVDERERACDEEVVRLGSEPQLYAESILKTCRLFVESPLACVSGVTGSDLKTRIEQIVRNEAATALSSWRKALLMTAAVVAVAGPLAVGAVSAPRLRVQSSRTESAPPAFEVASIKPNKSVGGPQLFRLPAGEQFTATNMTVGNLIRFAYDIRGFQLSGGPKWLESDRFDVVAKANGAPAAQIRLMMRALLVDRFELTLRKEVREMPAYSLVLARSNGQLGPRLHRSGPDCAPMPGLDSPAEARPVGPPAPADPDGPPRCGAVFGYTRVGGRELTVAQFANLLSHRLARLVIDRTGLTGTFDLDVEFTPDETLPPPLAGEPPLPPVDPNGPSIFTALQEQLGLKLESSKGPVEVLVIDHVEHPTDDQADSRTPDRAQTLPPSPRLPARLPPAPISPQGARSPAFEVASIKRVAADDQRHGVQPLQPGGLFRAVGLTLREFLRMSSPSSGPTAMLASQVVGGPAWVDSDRFEIVAKVPSATSQPDPAPQIGVLLRALLADRFNLRLHMETRQLPIFELVLAKRNQIGPRVKSTTEACVSMMAANAMSNQSRWCGVRRTGPGLLSGTGMPMTFWAGILSQRPEVDRVVRDRTGLTGDFDVDLEYEPLATPGGTSDKPSLFSALPEQLGLKLESTKGPVDVLVIDHAEKPTEN